MSRPADPGRTALVTGAARGIGRASALALAGAGWTVVAGVRDPSRLESFEAAAIRVVALDVTRPDSVRRAVEDAQEIAGGPLGCVVNNAGWALFGAVEDVDLEDARRCFETNFFGAMAVTQAALPAMREAGGGVVVNVSTLSGRVTVPLFGMYNASKLALAAATEALAVEMAPFGVRAALIEAGVVATDFARSTVISGSAGRPDSDYGPARDRVLGLLRGVRSEAPIAPQEVAAAIVAAASDPGAPQRIVIADPGLDPLLAHFPGPTPEASRHVIELFGLDGAPEP